MLTSNCRSLFSVYIFKKHRLWCSLWSCGKFFFYHNLSCFFLFITAHENMPVDKWKYCTFWKRLVKCVENFSSTLKWPDGDTRIKMWLHCVWLLAKSDSISMSCKSTLWCLFEQIDRPFLQVNKKKVSRFNGMWCYICESSSRLKSLD